MVREGERIAGLYFEHHWYRPSQSSFGPRDDDGFGTIVCQLEEYFAGRRQTFDLPTLLAGLAETVWPADPMEAARLAALSPLDRLADALTSRRLLLVLDNCEHVAAAPAVRLFTDRAAAVRPGFALDEATTGPVVRICRALDGIPLAIELAAARLRALTAAQVADRLDDRFRLLSVGDRTALPRHQTLRAVVDWSWELLDEAERAVLRRLSVFVGGATPASAEHVCALGGDQREVIDLVAALVDKSLVMATGEYEVRYQLLETVRVYAASRLAESGEEDRTRAAAFREVVDRWGMIMSLTGLASVELARAAPAEAIRLLSEAGGHASEGLAGNFGEMISISLGRALALAGEFDAARAELEHGIEAAERIGERDDHAQGYLELCDLARREGDLDRAHQQLDRALKIVDPHARRPDMIGTAAMTYSRAGCLASV